MKEKNLIILIPPSEGKSDKNTSNIKFKDTNFIFEKEVEKILDQLKLLDDYQLQKVYGVNLEKSKKIQELNLNTMNNKCSLSIERYTGVVYNQINWNCLSKKSKSYFNDNVKIFSGLFGLVNPKTLIPNYKLKMNSLSLAKFWSPILSKHLENEELVIDLLPQIHSKAYEHTNIKKIDFLINKEGKIRSAGHLGKVVKGQFIKFLSENCVESIEGFKKFNFDNYKWDGKNFIK